MRVLVPYERTGIRGRLPLIAALVVVLGFVPLASAQPKYVPDAKLFPAKAEKYGVGLTERYLRLWKQVGPDQAGANLVINGEPKAKVAESAERLDLWLHPPPVVSDPAPTLSSDSGYSTDASYAAPVAGSSGYSIPSDIVQCESGGNYSAVNPSSGAGGAYQILPSTWSAYGGSSAGPAGASPAEQDSIAAQIYADSGGSAWVC